MKLSPIQKAYIAGFLDGDGSIYVQAKPNQTYKYDFQIVAKIVFFQSVKAKDSFKEFHALLGLGNMRERKDGILEITINRASEIENFISTIGPFVRMKKKQVELLTLILTLKQDVSSKQDFDKLLKAIDLYRNLNYSKKRKKRS